MCAYLDSIHEALKRLTSEGNSFDMLAVRDLVREITGRGESVEFLPVKYESLAAYERREHGLEGWVLETYLKEIGGEPRPVFVFNKAPTPLVWADISTKRLDGPTRTIQVSLLAEDVDQLDAIAESCEVRRTHLVRHILREAVGGQDEG